MLEYSDKLVHLQQGRQVPDQMLFGNDLLLEPLFPEPNQLLRLRRLGFELPTLLLEPLDVVPPSLVVLVPRGFPLSVVYYSL